MILGRFLGGDIDASRRHGKEAHENRPGPPNQGQVNALILWQLLYVHYAARDGWYLVLCDALHSPQRWVKRVPHEKKRSAE
jgi:hypothetical protein